jgi:hypothetical protein
MLTRNVIAFIVGSALVVTGAVSALADGDPDISKGDCDLMSFCVGVRTGGKSNGQNGRGSSGGQNASGGSSKPADCHVRRMDPQPPPGSEYYRDGKTVYERVCAVDGQPGLVDVSFVGADPGEDVPQVDPAVLAQQAVDKMRLLGPDIGITPEPGGKGVVGMPVYMWTRQSAETYGPNTASASAGGITVNATAKVTKIVWQMGDGNAVTCTTAGTPYKAAYGKQPSPDCGYRYSQPSSATSTGRYHVTATSTWSINWQVAGGGESGQLAETRTSAVDITVAEVQVLN